MLKVSPPEMNAVSSGPPSPVAAFNSEQGHFAQNHGTDGT